jgi:Domain of unknown function (DUF4395)
MSEAHINFIKQQGFEDAGARTCDVQYPALMFQPRVIGVLVLAGVLLQSAVLFLTLSAVLWWSALVPNLNPFDKVYNGLVATRRGLPRLTAAPGPRRFAQALAATLSLLIAVSVFRGWNGVAWLVEGLFLVALVALIFGAFCFGSYVFHLITGNSTYARRTMPSSRTV